MIQPTLKMRSIVTLLVFASLVVILTLTVPNDYGHYASTFDLKGVPGFVRMPSVIAVQLWLAMAGTVMLPLGMRDARRRKLTVAAESLSIATASAILGSIGYVLAMGGIIYASRAGMFGLGLAGVFGMLLLPSLLLIGLAIIVTIHAYGIMALHK